MNSNEAILSFTIKLKPKMMTHPKKQYYTIALIGLFFMLNLGAKAQCNADFSYTVSGCNTFVFTDESTASPGYNFIAWQWDFGDGFTANVPNPAHIFPSGGLYNVTLTITADSSGYICSNSITHPVQAPHMPTIYFTWDSEPTCLNDTTYFYGTSGNQITDWYWNFDDGDFGTGQYIVHRYNDPGIYNVSLSITDLNQCISSLTHEVNVSAGPEVNITIVGNDTLCMGESVQFNGTSTSDIHIWFWDFGDGAHAIEQNPMYTYNVPGTYHVTLTVTAIDGCQATDTKTITVKEPPLANFNYQNACLGDTTYFEDDSYSASGYLNGWEWNFGDGSFSTDQNPTHYYANNDDYLVSLIANDNFGCSDTIRQWVQVRTSPITNIGSYVQVCDPAGQVYFFDDSEPGMSGAPIQSWEWHLDENFNSSEIDPEYIYSTTDTCYQVTLKVTDSNGCYSTDTMEVCLFGTLEVDFSITTTYAGYPTTFYASYSPEDDLVASYQWNFGDGTPNEITYNETIQHIFVNTGSYHVELSALDTNGCTAFVTHEVFVYSMPIVPIFPDNNAIWNTIGENNILNQNWHFRYGLIGDTLMSATKDTTYIYHKVFSLFDSTLTNPNSTYFGAIRSTPDKKVYVKLPDLPESLLYDFALEVGDTAWFTLGGEMCEELPSFREELHYKVVTAIDSVLLLNYEYRRRWHFAGGTMADTWIEGFGSIEWFGLFNPIISAYTYCGDSYSFACFKEDDVALYVNQPDCETCFCDMLTTVDHPALIDLHLSIYPNPAKDMVHVSLQSQEVENAQLRVVDVYGQLVFECVYGSNQTTTIDTKNWKSGLYIVLVRGTQGLLKKGTFIVE